MFPCVPGVFPVVPKGLSNSKVRGPKGVPWFVRRSERWLSCLVLPHRGATTLEDIETEFSRIELRHWVSVARLIKLMLTYELVPSLRSYFAVRGAALFGFGRSRAQQYLDALAIQDSLPEDMPPAPFDTALRPLSRVPAVERGNVWRLAHRIAGQVEGREGGLVNQQVVERVIACIRAQDDSMESYDMELVCKQYSKVYFSQETNEWYLDAGSLADVRYVLRHIHLDVASDATANERVKADAYICKDMDGLNRRRTPWTLPEGHPRAGDPINALCNAPGGVSTTRRTDGNSNSLQGLFLERAIEEFESGTVENMLLHFRAAVGHVWFDSVYKYPICFLRRHIKFFNPVRGHAFQGQSCHGSVWVFMGRDRAMYKRFLRRFGKVGYIPGHNSWSA